MVLLFIANAGLTVSEFAGIGASMEIFGVSRYIAVPLALVGIRRGAGYRTVAST